MRKTALLIAAAFNAVVTAEHRSHAASVLLVAWHRAHCVVMLDLDARGRP